MHYLEDLPTDSLFCSNFVKWDTKPTDYLYDVNCHQRKAPPSPQGLQPPIRQVPELLLSSQGALKLPKKRLKLSCLVVPFDDGGCRSLLVRGTVTLCSHKCA